MLLLLTGTQSNQAQTLDATVADEEIYYSSTAGVCRHKIMGVTTQEQLHKKAGGKAPLCVEEAWVGGLWSCT